MSPRLVPLARLLGLSVLCVGLSLGCGGGSNPPPPPANPQPDAAASTVVVDRATQVRADGTERVTITVTVKQQDGTPMAGRRVQVAVSGEGNTVTQPTGVTNASGVAVASVVSTSAGTKQVTATAEGTAGTVTLNARPSIEFITPRPTRVAFTATALSATAGVPMGGLEVALVDAAGNTLTSATDEVTLALAAGPGGATPEGTLTARAVAGVAHFNEVVLKLAGTGYQWRASAQGLEAGTSPTFTVAPAAAASVELSGLPATTTAGVAQSVEATLRDAFGNVATGYTGTLFISASDIIATLPADHTFTAQDAGRFTFTGITLRTAGSHRISLLDPAIEGLMASRDVTVEAAAPSLLSFTAVPVRGSVRTALGQVRVSLRDAFGNATTAGTPAVTLALVQGGATLGGVTEVAPVNGVATFSNLQVDVEGGFELRATAAGLTEATSSSINIVDDVAPALPSLSTGASTARTVTVTWTAVGDDRNEGQAVSQELRYSAAPINTDAEFDAATPVQGLGAPATAGTPESFTLSGLQPNRTYHVALRVTDNRNQSSRSASLAVQTVNAEVVSVVFSTEPADGTAGQPLETVRVALLDDHGDVVTSATSPVTLRLAGTAPFEPVTVEAVAGVATFNGLRVDEAGQWAFRAQAGNLVSVDSRRFTIQAAAASRLTLTGLVAPVIAGSAGSVEVTAYDSFGNVATGYTGQVRIASSDTEATLPGDYTFTAQDAGRHVFGGVVLATAAIHWVSVTDLANPALTDRFTVEVVGGSATRLELAGLSTAVTAGTPREVAVVARDVYGNIAIGYTGTVRFTSSDAQAGLPEEYTFTELDAGRQLFRVSLTTAGAQSVTVADTVNASLTTTVNTQVTAGPATRLTLALSTATTAAGQPVSATVTLLDAFGNQASGYRGTVGLRVLDDPGATVPADHTFTEADAGRHTFSVSFARVQNTTLVAEDTVNPGLSAPERVQVLPGVLAELRVTSVPGATTAGQMRPFEVSAYDRFGNLKTDYRGTVVSSASDAQATPLEEHAYSEQDQGRYLFGISFRTAGTQTATFTDAVAGVSGSFEFQVEAAEPTAIVLLSAPETGTVRAALTPVRVALRDMYGNTPSATMPAININLAGAPEGVELSGTRTLNPVEGVARFDGLSINEEGSYLLYASTENPAIPTVDFRLTITDDVAPAPAELSATLQDVDDVRLRWRATGDDGALGRAARYELRFSQEVIDAGNFGQAIQLPTGTPGDAGTQEEALAQGLARGRTHYFGLRIIDGAGNASALSLTSLYVPAPCDGHVCPPQAPACDANGVGRLTYTAACVEQNGEPTCQYTPVPEVCPGEDAACLEGVCGTATAPAPGELVISEVMHRPDVGTTEYFELTSQVDRWVDINGLVVEFDDGFTSYAVAINQPAGQKVVVGRNASIVFAADPDPATNGNVPVDVAYGEFLPLAGSGELTIRMGGLQGPVLDSLTYTPSFPQTTGRSMNLSSTVVGTAASQHAWYWCDTAAVIPGGTDRGTPGAANETCGVEITSPVNSCFIHSPKTIASPVVVDAGTTIYSRFYEDGVTNRNLNGNDRFPHLAVELGYGTSAADPASWSWTPAFFSAGYTGSPLNEDETVSVLRIPAPGSYLYGFRYRFTQGPAAAQEWVYCDQDGIVTSSGSARYGTVTVVPQGPPVANHVVISEVSARGAGTASTVQQDEFIELHNPTDTAIDLSGWQVQYKAATTPDYSTTNNTFTIPAGPGRIIPAHGYFLLARSAYTGAAPLDFQYSSFDMQGTTTGGGNVRINRPDGSGGFVEVDRLGWGTAIGAEGGTAAPSHPAPGGSVERKAVGSSTSASMSDDAQDGLRGNGTDTDNNSADFVQRATRQPQNSASPTERP